MAVESKRMQQRHGTYAQFQTETSDFLPHEFISVSTDDPNTSDGKALYYQPAAGNPKRILTDTDDTVLYHIDVTTTNPTYSVAKSNTIYLNGRVDGQQGIIITGATKLYQVYLGASTGRFLYRAYSGGDDYSDWIPYARAQITNQNKSRNDLIPSIKAVVDYISSQLSVINTDISNINTELSSVYRYKGTVATYQDLPSTGLTNGDVYNVEADGNNYAWIGTVWDKLGGDIDLSGYQTKIDNSHKLSSDLVDDTNQTNKFVTDTDKTNWNNKLSSANGAVKSSNIDNGAVTRQKLESGVIDSTLSTQGAAAEAAVTGAAINSISLDKSSQSITLLTGSIINEPDLITGLSIPYGTKIYVKLGFSANDNPIISEKAVQIRANGKFIVSLNRGAVNKWTEVTLSGQLTSGEIITRLGVYLARNVLSTQTDFILSVRSSIIKSINDNADNISEINADLGEIEDQLLQMEDTSNKVTRITGNEGVTNYPTALAVKAYVDAAIAAALNNS